MGKIVHIKELREFFSSTPVFSTRDVETVAGSGYSRLMLHNLTKRGEIKRLVRGYYTKLDDPMISVFCFRPAYLGLYTALSLHNLWEQETNVNIITSRNVRIGMRKILESNVNIRRINSRYMFGFDLIKYENIYLPVSDVEKTILDFKYFGLKLDRDILKNAAERIDKKKLAAYSAKFDKDTAETVFTSLKA